MTAIKVRATIGLAGGCAQQRAARLSPLVEPDDRDAIFGIEQTH
jgi:hypothetical protein